MSLRFHPAPVAPLFEIPVLLVSYLPVRDGRLILGVTGDVEAPLTSVRAHIKETTRRVVLALEEGSRFRRFRDSLARRSLGYRVADALEFFEPMPTFTKARHDLPMTDYNAIMKRIGIEKWLAQGVREVWIWGYHGGVLDLWESNMSGPWGDISNSDRDPTDLPVFDSTYTVYHYNYGRGPSEAVEDHMHQIEMILRHVDSEMFWDLFVGATGEGRCGWSHFPPNGERDYDWANPKWVETDLDAWHPDGGPKKRVNCRHWNCDSLTWFVRWMQNLPGWNNGIIYQGRELPNWWQWIGDFDGAKQRGLGLR